MIKIAKHFSSGLIKNAVFIDENNQSSYLDKYYVQEGFLPIEDELIMSYGEKKAIIELNDLWYPGRKEYPPFDPLELQYSKIKAIYENVEGKKYGVVSIHIENSYPDSPSFLVRTETFKLLDGKEIKAVFEIQY